MRKRLIGQPKFPLSYHKDIHMHSGSAHSIALGNMQSGSSSTMYSEDLSSKGVRSGSSVTTLSEELPLDELERRARWPPQGMDPFIFNVREFGRYPTVYGALTNDKRRDDRDYDVELTMRCSHCREDILNSGDTLKKRVCKVCDDNSSSKYSVADVSEVNLWLSRYAETNKDVPVFKEFGLFNNRKGGLVVTPCGHALCHTCMATCNDKLFKRQFQCPNCNKICDVEEVELYDNEGLIRYVLSWSNRRLNFALQKSKRIRPY